MAFQFSLQSVLQVRKLAEEREERILQRILQEIASTQAAIDRVDHRVTEVSRARRADVKRAAFATMLQAGYAEIDELRQSRAELQARLAKLEQLRVAQMAKYSEARRDREMLTDMRDQQRDAYQAQQTKQEQNLIDDTFRALARRNVR